MPQLTPIKAFVNTPITKHVIGFLAICSVMLSVFELKHYGSLSLNPHILQYKQYWRMFTVQMTVANESDLILCTLLWFHFKTVERFFGSAKYAALLVTFWAYNAVLTFIALCIGQLCVLGFYALVASAGKGFHMLYFDTVFNSVVSGPFAVLSSLYICHGTYVPVLYTFQILLKKKKQEETQDQDDGDETQNIGNGSQNVESPENVYLTLTNHFQIHALYALLILNHGFHSFLPCFIGAIVGRLYTQNLLVGSNFCLDLFPKSRFWHRKLVSHPLASGYVPVSRSASPDTPANEDEEVAIDDLTVPRAERSASPPRPLRRQILDAFMP